MAGDEDAFESFLDGLVVLPSTRLRTRRDFYLFLGGRWLPEREAVVDEVPAEARARRLVPERWMGDLELAIASGGAAEDRLAALQRLAQTFPANPHLGLELQSLRAEVTEAEGISTLLANDPDGSLADDLKRFHHRVLAEVRRRSGATGVTAYLAYLRRVWPASTLGRPPSTGAVQGDLWREPFLGLELVRIEPGTGSPFWITRRPVRQALAEAGSRDGFLSPGSAWGDVVEFAHRHGLALATVEQYRQAAGSIPVSGSFWAATSDRRRRGTIVRIESPGSVTPR